MKKKIGFGWVHRVLLLLIICVTLFAIIRSARGTTTSSAYSFVAHTQEGMGAASSASKLLPLWILLGIFTCICLFLGYCSAFGINLYDAGDPDGPEATVYNNQSNNPPSSSKTFVGYF